MSTRHTTTFLAAAGAIAVSAAAYAARERREVRALLDRGKQLARSAYAKVLRALESTPDEDAEAEQKWAEHHASEHTITHGELARARASELSRRPATSGPVLASAALHPARARRHG